MDVSNLLTSDAPDPYRPNQIHDTTPPDQQYVHQYPTRQSVSNNSYTPGNHLLVEEKGRTIHTSSTGSEPPPASPLPKTVTFELLFDGAANYRARLPLKVQIFPHDTTDSIVTTVKNFYGLYEGYAAGFSFEDAQGNILIARYENFRNDMPVFVRVALDSTQPIQKPYQSASPLKGHPNPQLEEGFQMPPPQQALNYGQSYSRPSSRVARKRSASPRAALVARGASMQKGRSRSGIKSRDTSVHGSFEDVNNDAANGYSSSDGAAGSISGSRKARSEQFASAEISLDNVLEGGRRKRAKFESSVSDSPIVILLPRSSTDMLRFARNCRSLCRLKFQSQIPFPLYPHSDVRMGKKTNLHSRDRRNGHRSTTSISSLLIVMALANICTGLPRPMQAHTLCPPLVSMVVDCAIALVSLTPPAEPLQARYLANKPLGSCQLQTLPLPAVYLMKMSRCSLCALAIPPTSRMGGHRRPRWMIG